PRRSAAIGSTTSTSTPTTRAPGGPLRSQTTRRSTAVASPSASTSTEPSSSFLTHPTSPSADAVIRVYARNDTPCTRPRTAAPTPPMSFTLTSPHSTSTIELRKLPSPRESRNSKEFQPYEPYRNEAEVHQGSRQHRARVRHRGRLGDASAGAHLRAPQRPGRQEGGHLRGGRHRDLARRLRLPPRPRLQLPPRTGRHLRVAVADPAVQPAHRRHRHRRDPAAQGVRALLRAPPRRQDQRRAPRRPAGQNPLRQPDPAPSQSEADPRPPPHDLLHAHHRPPLPHRQGSALLDRVPAARRQDRPPPGHRPRGLRQQPRRGPHRPPHRRAPRGGHGHAALRQ